jgi:MoaA/NifB/PqqE/SkfB family radical SAM enzyme
MCIRAETKDWQFQDMPLEDFRKLLPYLREVEMVVLEGWGESLLYKDLSQCIRLIKREGTQVGFVTSGKALTENRVLELIEAGLDFIGFSIAGTTPETHDAIRVNSHLPEIIHAIQLFNIEKLRLRIDWPRMHLVFLMLKDNIFEVSKVPSLARELGIEEVFLTNIIHMTNIWQEKQGVFVYGEGNNENEQILKQVEKNAQDLIINLKRPTIYASHVAICDENPLRNLYISVDGEVSPCVYLYQPLASPFKRIFCGEEYWLEKVSFGNIFRQSFSTIWNNESYVNFRDCFIQRERKFRDLSFSLWNGKMTKNFKEIELPGPPEPCKTCHKILGV